MLRVGALCALVACVSDARFVAAEHDDVGAPNFGLFDFASQFTQHRLERRGTAAAHFHGVSFFRRQLGRVSRSRSRPRAW